MVPMRTVSASARARDQSRLSTAAAALPLSSVLREVGMAFLPIVTRVFGGLLLFFFEVFGGYGGKSIGRGIPLAEVLSREGVCPSLCACHTWAQEPQSRVTPCIDWPARQRW